MFKEKTYFLNPVTLLMMIFLLSFIIPLGSTSIQYLVAVPAFITLGAINLRRLPTYLSLYLILGLSAYLLKANIGPTIGFSSFFYPLIIVFFKFWPVLVLARCIGSFTSSELMAAYRKIGLNEYLCIGIAIFFRFIPELKYRMQEIREAARIRHIRFSFLHPLRSLEVALVPLIYRGLAISDVISGSIITKGIEYPCKKTSYRNLCFTYRDGVAILICLAFLGVSLWQRIS